MQPEEMFGKCLLQPVSIQPVHFISAINDPAQIVRDEELNFVPKLQNPDGPRSMPISFRHASHSATAVLIESLRALLTFSLSRSRSCGQRLPTRKPTQRFPVRRLLVAA